MYEKVATSVKRQCTKLANQLITNFQCQFPNQDLMDAFGVVRLQYWLQLELGAKFITHLTILKTTFCHPKKVRPNDV
jgi:hypothetical protein